MKTRPSSGEGRRRGGERATVRTAGPDLKARGGVGWHHRSMILQTDRTLAGMFGLQPPSGKVAARLGAALPHGGRRQVQLRRRPRRTALLARKKGDSRTPQCTRGITSSGKRHRARSADQGTGGVGDSHDPNERADHTVAAIDRRTAPGRATTGPVEPTILALPLIGAVQTSRAHARRSPGLAEEIAVSMALRNRYQPATVTRERASVVVGRIRPRSWPRTLHASRRRSRADHCQAPRVASRSTATAEETAFVDGRCSDSSSSGMMSCEEYGR